MVNEETTRWLLEGDRSIQYQVHRDLLGVDRPDLRKRIETEGWGADILSRRRPDGHWGRKFYQPKWTSTHYTLLDLRNLCISPSNRVIRESIDIVAENEKAKDGGILPIGKAQLSDLCINGMFLNYAAYFKTAQEHLESVVDCVLSQVMPDGGFNCMLNRTGAVHSSLHTTISVLEGITEYESNGYDYRLPGLRKATHSAKEFILRHKLYFSHRTGEIIHKDFLRLSFPCRWRYDFLRALDYFRYSGTEFDPRMQPAIDLLIKKKGKDGRWRLGAKHPGQVHFEMEKAGKPSRWNTLRALRVLRRFERQSNSAKA
ncbi:MAG: hypothetical protein OEQ28_06975 [Acidobacteriota bacterium]|nr:hypothetical protein [Acidobacteriota bacterium]